MNTSLHRAAPRGPQFQQDHRPTLDTSSRISTEAKTLNWKICHRTIRAHLHSKHSKCLPAWDSGLKKTCPLPCQNAHSCSPPCCPWSNRHHLSKFALSFLTAILCVCSFLHLECPLFSSPIATFWNPTHSVHFRGYFFLAAFPVTNGERYLLEEKPKQVLAHVCELTYREEELKDLKDQERDLIPFGDLAKRNSFVKFHVQRIIQTHHPNTKQYVVFVPSLISLQPENDGELTTFKKQRFSYHSQSLGALMFKSSLGWCPACISWHRLSSPSTLPHFHCNWRSLSQGDILFSWHYIVIMFTLWVKVHCVVSLVIVHIIQVFISHLINREDVIERCIFFSSSGAVWKN